MALSEAAASASSTSVEISSEEPRLLKVAQVFPIFHMHGAIEEA
jgi:hypothetical protein